MKMSICGRVSVGLGWAVCALSACGGGPGGNPSTDPGASFSDKGNPGAFASSGQSGIFSGAYANPGLLGGAAPAGGATTGDPPSQAKAPTCDEVCAAKGVDASCTAFCKATCSALLANLTPDCVTTSVPTYFSCLKTNLMCTNNELKSSCTVPACVQ